MSIPATRELMSPPSIRSLRPSAANAVSPAPNRSAAPRATRPVQASDAFDVRPSATAPAQNGPLPAPLPHTPIETLYTDPFHQDTLGDRFVQLVDDAKTSVNGAFYEILDDRIVGAFVRAAQRGVQVHLVTDDNYFKSSDTQASLDRNVAALSQVYSLIRSAKAIRTTKPDWQQKAQALLDQLPAVQKAVDDAGMPDDLKPDLTAAHDYLAALAGGDATGALTLKKDFYALSSAVTSRLGKEKVRQQFRPAYDQLLAAGVQLRDDESSKLTHDKYMVIDQDTTFVGSYNLQGLKSDGGAHAGMYCTADNAMVLHSADLAKSFLADFSQMFDEGKFHDDKQEIDAPTVKVGGVKVTPFFAPKDTLEANVTADLGALLERMRAANEAGHPLSPPPKIRVAGFAMSYDGTEALVDTLALLHREGADVEVVADALSAGTAGSSVKALRERGVPVIVTHPEVMMHDKFISVDTSRGSFVYTGSANFTHPAYFENDEAVLKVESRTEARAYEAMFDSLRDDATTDAVSGAPETAAPSPTPVQPEDLWTRFNPESIDSPEAAARYATARWGL